VLAVAMGVGRFAYTPLLAVMRHDAGLSVAMSGALASTNLAGYLIGALVATNGALRSRRYVALCVAAAVVVVTTAAMALPEAWWLATRFVTGVASGIAFVLTVSLMLDGAARTRSTHGIALAFSGVGLGIAFAGIAVPVLASFGGSRLAWIGLAVVSAALLAFALPRLADEPATVAAAPAPVRTSVGGGGFVWLCVAYGIEGFAYIIPATYLVAMIDQTPGLAHYSAATWVVVGLCAAPGAATWNAAGRRFGKDAALVAALVVQALGLLATVAFPGIGGALAIAVTLGTTFVGITAVASALARDMRPLETNAAVGTLTVVYGVGQIAGPLVAVRVSLATGRYRDAFVVAAVALLAGAALYAARLAFARSRARDAA